MLTSLLLGSSLFFACSDSELENKPSAEVRDVEKKEKKEVTKKEPTKKKVNVATKLSLKEGSKVGFVGSKMLGQSHTGGFDKVTGEAGLDDKGALVSLSASIDMASTTSDNPKLTKHLMAPDFFDVAKYPTAVFTSTEVSKDKVTGVLQLRGKEKEVSFPAVIVASSTEVTLKSEFLINRKDWDVNYAGRKDNLIKDDVLIKLDVQYGAAAGK